MKKAPMELIIKIMAKIYASHQNYLHKNELLNK
jgi:hypothetical protein